MKDLVIPNWSYGDTPTVKSFAKSGNIHFEGYVFTTQYFIEHKELTSTGSMSAAKRAQMKYQMKACKIMGKDNYLIFEGVRNDDWINKAVQYANDFKVSTKIELNGVLIHDLTF